MTARPKTRGGEEGVRTAVGHRSMHLSLRANERLFLNGAVLRPDRKVTLELLNDATFLLENHVLQVEDTYTPLRQLYFAGQAILMDPQNAGASRALFDAMAAELRGVLSSITLREGVVAAQRQVACDRTFHALKTLRSLFAEEEALLGTLSVNASQLALGGRPSGDLPYREPSLSALQ